MRKTILLLTLMLLSMSSAIALFQPESTAPIPPVTVVASECEPWETKSHACSEQIHSYLQCVKTVSGGVWQPKSENCEGYGEGVKCFAGKCVRPQEQANMLNTALIVGGIIILIVLFSRRKK